MASSVSTHAAPATLVEGSQGHPTTAAPVAGAGPAPAHDNDSDVQEEEEAPRPQAGPLPRKRGEIGFREGIDDVQSEASTSTVSLPARHPADRAPSAAASSSSLAAPPAPGAGEPPRSPSRTDSTHSAGSTGKRSIISFFKPKRIPTYGGLRLTSLAVFLLEILLLCVTITGWVLVATHMSKTTSTSTSDSDPSSSSPSPSNSTSSSNGSSGSTFSNDSSTTSGGFDTSSSQIFVHVAFALVAIAELVFLERALFRLRAERYAFKHPGELLPRTRGSPSSPYARGQRDGPSMGFAPWNRPPLPTYAAALAQSGVGTGDVEDNVIAIPPPPAYGNTRGSTMLLQGFLTEALRAQRPRSGASVSTQGSGRSGARASGGGLRVPGSGGGGDDGEDGERPKSYVSVDSEWEARLDADRALVLEETLQRLEEGGVRRA